MVPLLHYCKLISLPLETFQRIFAFRNKMKKRFEMTNFALMNSIGMEVQQSKKMT